MTIEIIKPNSNPYLKALVFGPYGGGKTVLLGTANDDPRTSPMLLLDYEGGYSSLAGRDIDVVRIRSWQDYNEAYALLASGQHEYKSIGLDSISETHVFALLNTLLQPGRKGDPDMLQQGDYGKVLVQMRRLLREFRDLPLHVFMTALDKDDIDPQIGTVKKPSLTGALANEAPGLFDLVGYLSVADVGGGETKTVERVLFLQNYPTLKVKVRAAWQQQIPNELIAPTVTSVLDLLHFD